ncbi:DNA-binding transcriptional regulator, XRE family [Actinopolyspora mzabensis]|uniref:DNA-binding transcriptional regulator, XRE family n=1 Tax=Actinopolyspora mzabensis TaxID=995066 RepID=A0A1G8Y4F6_ACTMZ|nr:helix-turn-helix transcriptional regulator [Actinopolyspora mzabensis]SDJ97025.1 DNA-binding transcriptional regulator, XRE family [Actinopolyspora mzabensis]
MKWNLRLVAAHRGIWKAGELQNRLAEYGLAVSAGKMSGLWSGTPVSLKLSDLDIICAALDCEIGELLVPETAAVPVNELAGRTAAAAPRDDQRTGM